jgi:DNA-binding NarL/FixJ family response regulator
MAALLEAGFSVAGSASNADELLQLIRESRPDVAVLDGAMLGVGGQEVAAACTKTRIVIFTGSDRDTVLREGIEAGARGYVFKSQPLEVLVEAVGIVARGGSWVDPGAAPTLVARSADMVATLTPRERDVLALVAFGRTYADIAERLSITVSTVQQHVTSAMDHLSADTRTEAVATALRLSLIA